MAAVNYQYELMKMYLAAFIRAPEKSGLEYWLYQLDNGKSFDSVLETVFSLDIVKSIYSARLSTPSFVTLIYANVFGKTPDIEGLNYWSMQMDHGRSRGNLVMDMINTGLATPDGTPGKAYILNRLAVSQLAVNQQFTQHADFSPDFLKSVMASVSADTATVTNAGKAMTSSATGIGLGIPLNVLKVAAALDGLNATEIKAGVSVVVDLSGTNALVNNILELQLNRSAFSTPVTKVLTSADITAQKVTIVIPNTINWGIDGNKTLSALVKDNSGNTGLPGGDLVVDLNAVAPYAPSNPLVVTVASNGINATEKSADIQVKVDLSGTTANVGDKVDILIGGQVFAPGSSAVLTDADIKAGFANVLIPVAANWGADGDKTLSARVTDITGNIGAAGGNLLVTLDTTAPAALINTLAISAATGGISPSEKAANMNVLVNLSGANIQTGDILELLIDGKTFINSTRHVITATDISTLTSTLTITGGDAAWGNIDGDKTISVRAIDFAGNIGASGGSLKVTLDSTAPSSQNTILSALSAVNGINSAERIAGVDVAINLSGTGAVAGDVVSLQIGGVPFAPALTQTLTAAQITAATTTITIPSGASWGADGSKVLSATITDASGNVGMPGGTLTVILDTIAPKAPSNPIVILVAVNNISASEKLTGVNVLVDLSGTTALVGEKVELLLGASPFNVPVIQTLTQTDITNNFVNIVIPNIAGWGGDGSKDISVRVIDVAGNIGVSGGNLISILDTTAPSGPSNPMTVPANAGGGINVTEKAAGVLVNIDLTGTSAVAGDILEILSGGTSFTVPVTHILTGAEILLNSAAVTIALANNWGADGVKTLTAKLTDSTGNTGAAGGLVTITILDTTPPNAPFSNMTVAAALNGINASEKIAGVDVTAYLAGTLAVAGDIANLFIDGVAFASPVSHSLTAGEITAGNFLFTIANGSGWGTEGAHVLTMGITDVAGNVGAIGGNVTVSLDTIAPTVTSSAVVVSVASNGINAAEKTAGVVVQVDLTGTGAVANDKLEILLGGTSFTLPVLHTLTSAEILAGTANATINTAAGWGVDGTKTISARVVDIAGNNGAIGGTLTTTLDITMPAAVGLPTYSDVDVSTTMNAGDTFVFTVSEATTKAIAIGNMTANNGHIFGAGAAATWNPAGTQLTLTLGAGATVAAGDTLTLVGVSDLVGNSLNLAFSI